MDDQREPRPTTGFVGFVIPAALAVDAIWNLVAGEVWLGPDRGLRGKVAGGLFWAYCDPWRVCGAFTFKFGIATGLCAWYGLANFGQWDRFVNPLLGAAIALTFGGFISFAVGFFV